MVADLSTMVTKGCGGRRTLVAGDGYWCSSEVTTMVFVVNGGGSGRLVVKTWWRWLNDGVNDSGGNGGGGGGGGGDGGERW